jgi:homoserine dehydrogenase
LDGCVAAYIEPAFMPTEQHEAAVPQNFNLISLTGQHIGKQSFYGQGAGRYPTAYNVLQDCVDVRNGLTGFYTDKLEDKIVDNSSIVRPYYVRTNSVDKWLQCRIERIMDCGVLTKPVSVSEMHAWARQNECFIASIR